MWLLEELHHRVKNTLAIVIVITSQTLRTADNLEQGRLSVEPVDCSGPGTGFTSSSNGPVRN
jgi:two-component sensor histidine kinase